MDLLNITREDIESIVGHILSLAFGKKAKLEAIVVPPPIQPTCSRRHIITKGMTPAQIDACNRLEEEFVPRSQLTSTFVVAKLIDVAKYCDIKFGNKPGFTQRSVSTAYANLYQDFNLTYLYEALKHREKGIGSMKMLAAVGRELSYYDVFYDMYGSGQPFLENGLSLHAAEVPDTFITHNPETMEIIGEISLKQFIAASKKSNAQDSPTIKPAASCSSNIDKALDKLDINRIARQK